MKHHILHGVGLALRPALLAPLLAAGVPEAEGTPAAPLRLFGVDSGRTMTLPVGAVLRVDLDANYSTGSEWQRRHDWLDKQVPSFTSRQEASTRLLETIQ